MKTYKRLTALLLSMLMVVSLAAPAFSFTIAVVTTEKAPGAGELISPDGLVTIAYNVDAGIPEGATVEVSEVDSEDYLPSVNLSGQKIVASRFVDISIRGTDGSVIEPNGDVKVRISFDAPQEGTLRVVHFPAEETVIEDAPVPLFSGKKLMSAAATALSTSADEEVVADGWIVGVGWTIAGIQGDLKARIVGGGE